ncbi:hypothetical protein ATKI12_6938 [Kitasatospora sp. Ki12]
MSMTPVMKKYKFSMRMVDALMSGESADGAHGRTGTLVALIDRQMVTSATRETGGRHLLTEKGREALAELRAAAQPETLAGEAPTAVDTVPQTDDQIRVTDGGAPTYKTVIKAETTWTLQSRKDDTDAWSYVSDHGSEEAATLRAHALLIDGSRRHFRVIEHCTEVRATDPIEPPKDTKSQPEGPRYVVEPVRLGFAVVDTSTGKPEARMGSRYAANDMADRLNAELAQ